MKVFLSGISFGRGGRRESSRIGYPIGNVCHCTVPVIVLDLDKPECVQWVLVKPETTQRKMIEISDSFSSSTVNSIDDCYIFAPPT